MSCSKLEIKGTITDTSSDTSCESGIPSVLANLDLSLFMETEKQVYNLTSDSEVTISLGGFTNIHFLYIKAVGGKIRVKVTSTDGAAQLFPCEPICMLVNNTVPLTDIKVQRVALSGIDVKVYVLLGQIPS